MKDILIQGHRIATTDAVADAIIDYARVLAREHRTDVVEFPSVHDGMPARCVLTLGAHTTLAVMSSGDGFPSTLRGAEEAAAEIRRQADEIR